MVCLNPEFHEILDIGSPRRASDVNAVIVINFETVYKQLEIGHFKVFFPSKSPNLGVFDPWAYGGNLSSAQNAPNKNGGSKGSKAPPNNPPLYFYAIPFFVKSTKLSHMIL